MSLSSAAVQCPMPEDPINGKVLVTTLTYNSIARYECKYGFKLHGPQNRSCTSTKHWSDEQPKCLGLCACLMIDGSGLSMGSQWWPTVVSRMLPTCDISCDVVFINLYYIQFGSNLLLFSSHSSSDI